MISRRLHLLMWIAYAAACGATAQDYELVPAFPNLDNIQSVLFYDPPETFYVTTWNSTDAMQLLRTGDGGAAWSVLTSGLGIIPGFDHEFGPYPDGTYAVSHQNPNILYKQDINIHRSNDGGSTWHPITDESTEPGILPLVTYGPIAVSPTKSDVIVYYAIYGHGGQGITFWNVKTNEKGGSGWVGGYSTSPFWTHPQTGNVFRVLSRHIDTISLMKADFDNMVLESVGGAIFYSGFGYGFASDNPDFPLTIAKRASRNPVVSVFQTSPDGQDEPIFEWDSANFIVTAGRPTSIAFAHESRAVFVSLSYVHGDRDRQAIYLTHDNGVSHWKEVAQISGRMFFLTGYDLPFVQTNDNLFKIVTKTPTDVSSVGKAATTWGELKRDR